MKAYNEQWIYNRAVLEQAERWHQQRLLTDNQLTAVQKAYPVSFRQTNGFLEIGLFLFTTVAILACYLLPATMFSLFISAPVFFGLFNIAFGVAVGLVGQLLIRRRLLYRNGIDNAFVVTMAGFLTFGFNQFLPDGLSVATHCLFTLPLLLLILWYTGDTLMAFFALGTFYAAIFDGLLTFGWGKSALPFVLMGVSGLLYWLSRFVSTTGKNLYYADALNLTQWIALLVLAASGNYFVVRELNGLLLKLNPSVAPEIALPALFWLLTVLTPGVYLWQGFGRKDRILLILGVLGLIAAAATVYSYTDFLPFNLFLTLGGLLLIGITISGIRYLSKPKYGFTDAPNDDSPDEFFINTETVAAIQAAAGTQHGPKDGVRFGGGEFGGAGSEGTY